MGKETAMEKETVIWVTKAEISGVLISEGVLN